MGKNADISWLHPPGWLPGATWSPWHGCSKKHTGCLNCWAETMSHRFGKDNWGRGKPRRVTSESGWKHPLAWARAAARAGQRMLVSPLDCDPLDAEVYQRSEAPDGVACRATFDRFMHLIAYTSPGELVGGGLVWLLLTKRPENWRWIPEDVRPYCWLLYSASDQPTLEDGMAHLRHAEGFAGLGLSLEPLVGPIAFESAWLKVLNWVIIGGESGRNARPCDVAWLRAIVRQCREAGVAPYVKQLGRRVLYGYDATEMTMPDGHGGDMLSWPSDMRVQEFPEGLR